MSEDKDDFLYPRSRYRGDFKPENVVFNANLQEFTQKISYICNLETGGKITPDEAYQEIKKLWKELKKSKKELGIDGDSSDRSEGQE
jgi:sulfopyruvate decarboxylase TPP-binding subunit